MNKFDLVKRIEIFAPPETQEQWDCSGWSVCTDKQQVNKVMLALTVTDNIVKQAKEKKCDTFRTYVTPLEVELYLNMQ